VLVVGLTGGIGSGKSEVAAAFGRLGIEVVDTDALAHELSRPGQAGFKRVIAEFGDEFLLESGELDRAKLRRSVFADAPARARLESALHPPIATEARRRIGLWKGPYGIVVVPLLFERGGLRSIVDRVLVVDCSEAEQIRRVIQRSGLAPAEVRAIMATQVDRATRLTAADDILDNGGPRDAIAARVAELDQHYRKLAAAAPGAA
jgi:dephospho-CoA kinase